MAPLVSSSTSSLNSSSLSPSSVMILCTADGALYAIDAWTGQLSSTIHTEALLLSSSSSIPSPSSSSSSASPPTTTNRDNDDDSENYQDITTFILTTDNNDNNATVATSTNANHESTSTNETLDDQDIMIRNKMFHSNACSSTQSETDPLTCSQSMTVPDGSENEKENDDSNAADEGDFPSPQYSVSGSIFPGLDGYLYYWIESEEDYLNNDNEGTNVDDEGYVGRDDGTREQGGGGGGQLTQLPVTMAGLLDNPVETCDPTSIDNNDDIYETRESNAQRTCGILTATLETSLLAVNEQGQLLWKQGSSLMMDTSSSTSPPHELMSQSSTILVLQRKDYHVRQVSTSTGQPVWNVTLGTWHAIDFLQGADNVHEATNIGDDDDDISSESHDIKLLPDRVDGKFDESLHLLHSKRSRHSLLPSLVFTTGKEILAVHPVSHVVLWKLETSSVLASVFGIYEGRWESLQVLSEGELALLVEHKSAHPWSPQHEAPTMRIPTLLRLDSKPAHASSLSSSWHDYHTLYDAPLMHWFQHYQKQQQALVPRLESSFDKYHFPKRINDIISSECDQDQSRDCPVWRVPHQLRLPSPFPSTTTSPYEQFIEAMTTPASASTSAAQSSTVWQPEGLLLSWSVVATMVVVFVYLIVLGWIWYSQKKQSWIALQRDRVESVLFTNPETGVPAPYSLEKNLLSHSHSLEVPIESLKLHRDSKSIGSSDSMVLIRRTLSLPNASMEGELILEDKPDFRTRQTSLQEVSSPVGSDAKSHSLVTQPLTTGMMEDDPLMTANDRLSPSTVGATGIPLVRYSRYSYEYKEVGPLGKGGFGSVYRCQNVLDGREYAIKKVSIRSFKDDNVGFELRLERTLREVKILAVLDHPNIVRYFGAWLEIEEDEAWEEQEEMDESIRGMSRCYSSSMITESISKWRNLNQKLDQESFEDDESYSYNPLFRHPVYNRRIPLDDCGFIFEESEEDGMDDSNINDNLLQIDDHNNHVHSLQKEHCQIPTRSTLQSQTRQIQASVDNDRHLPATKAPVCTEQKPSILIRHTLYIQMQLCSHSTISDFLSNAVTRRGCLSDSDKGIDVPLALRLFLQIADAVRHVHQQGLIHRDLKPQNCFMDDSRNVKVGDFGLSRESADSKDDECLLSPSSMSSLRTEGVVGEDHTAGVGTRVYASPEQMNGSDYDSSTDVYSLGIMLFELVYPMYTGMERNICLSRLRQVKPCFPIDWDETVGLSFPSLQGVLESMLSTNPSDRLTAVAVVHHIQTILNEFTIVSLEDLNLFSNDVILLRIEAEHRPDALSRTIQAIEEAARELHYEQKGRDCDYDIVKVVQYGLRSSNATAIMEFALLYKGSGSHLVAMLTRQTTIIKVRQVSTAGVIGTTQKST